jgi:HEAT repeat protein
MSPSRLLAVGAACLVTVAAMASPPPAQSAEERATEVMSQALLSPDWGLRMESWHLAAPLSAAGLEAAARHGADSPDRDERALALELLARIDVARNRDIFQRELDSSFRSVRVRAIRALTRLADPALIPLFERVLAKDTDPDLRALAAEALGHPWAGAARPALRRAVADPRPVVQQAAVRALVATGDLSIGHELLSRALDLESEEVVRLVGLVALVPDRALVPRLAEMLSRPDAGVRVAAAAAILTIADASR